MIDRCKECGTNLAMVGIKHRCIPGAAQSLAMARAREFSEARNRKSNPFEDAARRRDIAPNTRAGAKPLKPKPRKPSMAVDEGGRTVGSIPATGAKLSRGRPKITAARPWETEGISRRTWYRRQEKSK